MTDSHVAPGGENERELARRVRDGDAAAEQTVIAALRPGLYAIALVRAGSSVAPDVVQETLIAVLSALRSGAYRGDAPLGAFAAAVLRRQIARAWQRTRETHPLDEEWPSADDGPALAAEREETARRVRGALDELPGEHREVVERFYFEDESAAEIASGLGIPRGTVLSRLHNARRKLAEILNRTPRRRNNPSRGR